VKRTVESTAYCLKGTMANTKKTHAGVVAMAGVPFGTKYRILSGPMKGHVVTVEDRPDNKTQFDIWMADCHKAIQYGRHVIEIEAVK
jgi:hypothetical protein